MSIRLIRTGDGSSSLLNETLNETYHSTHGALRESLHVFIGEGLRRHGAAAPRILEFGFGTGLNVLLTALVAADSHRHIQLTTLEAFPLSEAILRQLNYPDIIAHQHAGTWFGEIHACPWETDVQINEFFSLTKIHTTFESYVPDTRFDIIYFDAFAPSRQPELWERNILSSVVRALNPGGIFVTYSARGQLKRDLASLGLQVETLPGPPGKKEMVRATNG